MLIYHPAFDAFHCLVRICAILERVPRLEVERLRLLDFCLCFPSVIGDFRLPQSARQLRGLAKQSENPYRLPIGPQKLLEDIQPIHEACLGCLAAAELIEYSRSKPLIKRTEIAFSSDLKARCTRIQEEEHFFFESALAFLEETPLAGDDGLKARSGLMEYRYDVV